MIACYVKGQSVSQHPFIELVSGLKQNINTTQMAKVSLFIHSLAAVMRCTVRQASGIDNLQQPAVNDYIIFLDN